MRRLLVVVAGVAVASMLAGLVLLPYDIAGAGVAVVGLAAVSTPLLVRACRGEDDLWVRAILVAGLVAICVAGLVRYQVFLSVYGHLGDVEIYQQHGVALARQFWHGDFTTAEDLPMSGPLQVGTQAMFMLTGVAYALVGPTLFGAYLCFSWIAFWGLYLCYRAGCIATPELDRRRFALLVFFLPSTLFWSSGIGKEAWIMLGIGLCLYGTARLCTDAAGAVLPLLAGVALTTVIRPHIAVALIAAMCAALLLPLRAWTVSRLRVRRLLALGLLGAAGVVALVQVGTLFSLDRLSPQRFQAQFETVRNDTSTMGGSAFAADPLSHPLELPETLLTVLFRPFPWEAHNVLMLLTSAESAGLAILVVLSWRRLARLPQLAWRNPYVVGACVAILLLAAMLSVFGNFGVLVRERLMLMPFVLLLLCVPPRTFPRRWRSDRRPHPERRQNTHDSSTSYISSLMSLR